MNAKIALWLGVLLMGVGIADSHFNGATMLGLSFRAEIRGVSDAYAEANPRPPKSPLERISSSLEDARNLSARVTCLVDTLIGSRPEAEGKGLEKMTGGGIILSLSDNAENAAAHIRKAQDELHRLSTVLGLGV